MSNCWAEWQLGALAADAGQMDEALIYFSQATETISDPTLKDRFQQAYTLVSRQKELQRQSMIYHQAYLNTEQSRQETLSQIQEAIYTPPDSLPSLLGMHGWLNAPLILKLSPPPLFQPPEPTHQPGLWRQVLNLLRMQKLTNDSANNQGDDFLGSLDLPLPVKRFENEREELTSKVSNTDIQLPEKEAFIYATSYPYIEAKDRSLPDQAPLSQEPEQAKEQNIQPSDDRDTGGENISLIAYMLGGFRLSINDTQIQKWPGAKGQAVLKYLLAHHSQGVSRDILMDTFWKDADPEAARNNLNVALYGLRQALRTVTKSPVIIFENGNYCLGPRVKVLLDMDEFEHHFNAGSKLEANGELLKAQNEFEVAASLYQGDFMADDPYEEWPVLTRERLRVAYLDMLDRLSRIYFSMEQYTACINLCQIMLERDNCREDAHRLLMRCYSRQGQHHLALRQYQVCIDNLKAELDVEPETTTVKLAERIRRRERV